jgi:hypothetical protein
MVVICELSAHVPAVFEQSASDTDVMALLLDVRRPGFVGNSGETHLKTLLL